MNELSENKEKAIDVENNTNSQTINSVKTEISLHDKETKSSNIIITSPLDHELKAEDVRLHWSKIFIVGFIIAIIIIAINLFVLWIIHYSISIIYLYSTWFLFIESGLLFIFGGCIGTVKQSFTLDRIRTRFMKGEKITGADTKIAIGSAYTYFITAIVLGVASIIAWVITRE